MESIGTGRRFRRRRGSRRDKTSAALGSNLPGADQLDGLATGPAGEATSGTPLDQPDPRSAGEALPGRWLVFAVMAIALLMVSVDQTIVATALNTIQQDLDAELTWSGWTITVYSLGQIIVMPVAGRLSDQIGRKKVLLIAVGLFTLASVCCGLATNIYQLVALRAIQALGGGAFVPSATGIVADQFGPNRDRAIGMFTSIFPIGGIIGPILGGVLVTYWSWRAIFLINVPTGLLLLCLAARLVTETPRRRRGKVDLVGVALLGSVLLSSMYGLTHLGSRWLTNPLFVIPELCAIAAAVLFVRHTATHRAPFIPLLLLRGKGFGAMNVVNLLFGGAVLGFGVMVPLYAELRYHLDPLSSGTLLTARGVGMICTAGLAVLTLRRFGHRIPIVVGFGVLIIGLIVTSIPPPHGVSAYLWLAIATGVTGIGMGVAVPATNNAVLQLAPDRLASIAGLRGMFRQSGSIIAISITTAILAGSTHPAQAQAHAFLAFAVLLLAAVPLVFAVPDHRGNW